MSQICPYCKNEIENRGGGPVKFCTSCGYKLDTNPVPVSAPENNNNAGYNNNGYGNNTGYTNDQNHIPIVDYNDPFTTTGKVTMVSAIQSVFKNFSNFRGRSRRSEYWYAMLANFLVLIGASFVMSIFASSHELQMIGGIIGFFIGIYSLIVLIPLWAVTVRRLHDIGKKRLVDVA